MPRYCTRCVLPDSRPGVRLDPAGVCGACRNWETKATIDWATRAAAFDDLAEAARDRAGAFDCVVPVSGGKDSFWQVVTCLEHGLRPLCLTYVHPGRTSLGERNLRCLLDLGVEHRELRLDPDIERAFIVKAFRATAISGLVTHMAIYTWPLRVALEERIPLVVYGEDSAFEYSGDGADAGAEARVDGRWRERFGVTAGTTVTDWVDAELTATDVAALAPPDDDLLLAAGIDAVFLGRYFRWDPETSRRVAVDHGFEARAEGPRVGTADYVNIDDDLIGVHHHPKWHKYGITRSFDTLSIEIRAGRLSRVEAVAELAGRGAETPWADIDAFCAYAGLSTSEYFDVLERFRNPDLWREVDGIWQIDDFLIPEFDWPAAPVPAR